MAQRMSLSSMAWQLDLRWLLSRQLLSPYTATRPACTARLSPPQHARSICLLHWLLYVRLTPQLGGTEEVYSTSVTTPACLA